MKTNIIAILCLGASTQISALTLDEYTEKLSQEHPFYSQLSLSEEARQLAHQASRLVYDWNTQMSANSSHSSASSVNYSKTEISTQKAIKKTGGSLSVRHSWTDNGLTQPTNLTSITYSQPLLENKKGINTNLSADIADIDFESKRLSLVEQSEGFLASKIKRFIDLALAQERVALIGANMLLSEQQLNIAVDKYKQSILSESGMLQEQDNHIRARQQLLQAEQELSSIQVELAMWANFEPQLMIAEFDFFQEQTTLDTDTLDLVAGLRIIQQLSFDRQKLQRQLASNQNKLKPSLNINVGLTSQGNANSYLDSFSNQNSSFEMGLNFAYPFGNAKEKLDIRLSQNSLAQLDSRQQENEANLAYQINMQVARIKLLQKMMEDSLAQSTLAEAKAKETMRQYENAMSQKNNVLAAQKNANTVKLSYLQAATNLQKGGVDYLSLTDRLVSAPN